jgi:hypothetical protein
MEAGYVCILLMQAQNMFGVSEHYIFVTVVHSCMKEMKMVAQLLFVLVKIDTCGTS